MKVDKKTVWSRIKWIIYNILHCCDLVLNINRSQSLVHLVQDPLTLEAAAPTVQASHDDAVWADQHRVPAQREAVAHSLATGGTVTEQSVGHTDEENSAGAEANSVKGFQWICKSVICFNVEGYSSRLVWVQTNNNN